MTTYNVTDNLDQIPALKDGDTVALDSGKPLNATRTLNPRLNGFVGTPKLTDKPAHVKVPSPPGKFIDFVSSSGENAVVQNVVVETTGPDAKLAAAVRLSGKNQRVTNVRQIGVGRVLIFGGASGAICDNIYANTATCGEYAMGSFGEKNGVPIWNDDCKIIRCDINVTPNPSGVHAGRYEHTRRCQWGTMDAKVKLAEIANLPGPKGNGFAARAQSGKFTALAINDGEDAKVLRFKVEGILALGPIEIWAQNHNDWRMKRPVVQECEVDALVCNRGTTGLKVKDCKIGRFEINHGIPGSFTDCDGTIEGTTFTDPARKPPVNPKLTYLNSFWCGKKLGVHGEVG